MRHRQERHGATLSRLALAGAAIGIGLSAVPAAAPAAERGTSFFDDFDSFNPRRWLVSDGWANGDWQNCTWARRAVTLGDGYLRLSFIPEPSAERANLCGEVQSRAVYGYGTYEARLRTPAGSGLNAAFFTYTGPPLGTPHDEIDFEVLTRDTGRVSLNTYVGGTPRNGAVAALAAPADAGFVTYAFTWSRDAIRWYVDGVQVHEASGPDLPVNPQRILASLWGSDTLTDWMGPFRRPPAPVTMEVDWIAFTAEGEGCRFAGSVLCR